VSAGPGPFLVLFGRWVSGRRLVGRHPGVSTFWRRDDTALRRYWRHSGLRRLVEFRVLPSVLVVGVVAGVVADPGRAIAVLSGIGIVGAVVVMVAAGVGAWSYRYNRFERQPLYAKLAGELKGLPPTPTRGSFVMARRGDEVRLRVPKDLAPTPAKRRAVLSMVEEHTRRDYEARWELGARPPRVVFTVKPVPPKLVSWPMVLPALDTVAGSELVLGLDGRSAPVTYDLDAESPHLLLSIGTGGGKSTELAALICQLLRKKGPDAVDRVIVLDIKWQSLNCLDGVDRVEIYREIGDMARVLEDLKQVTIEDRKRGPVAGGRIVVVAEELNWLMQELQNEWLERRKSDDKKRAPAVEAIGTILVAGRALRINVVAAAQKAMVAAFGSSSGATGGSTARDQFGVVVLGRFSASTWKSFTGKEGSSRPITSDRPGDTIRLLQSGEWDQMQMILIGDEEAHADAVASSGPATVPLPTLREPTFSLREASNDEGAAIVDVSYAVLRKRKSLSAVEWRGDGGRPERFTAEQLHRYLQLPAPGQDVIV
jgi:hypothetical protein